jgi:hypothetical protein
MIRRTLAGVCCAALDGRFRDRFDRDASSAAISR